MPRKVRALQAFSKIPPFNFHGADAKLDSKHQLYMVNELAELSSCNNALFFEARRHQDLYLWAAKTPNGPSVRFHVLNSHTMDEMKMTGNCLRGSRPIITFDKTFDTQPHWRLIKELFTHVRRSSLLLRQFLIKKNIYENRYLLYRTLPKKPNPL